MTLTLTHTFPHFDVMPSGLQSRCLLDGCTAYLMDVLDRDGHAAALWSGEYCMGQYTTLFTPRPCPGNVSWCILHDRGVDGLDWHRTPTVSVRAVRDRDMGSIDEAVYAVRGVVIDDYGQPLPLVWIACAFPQPSLPIGDGVGLTPAHARQFGQQLIQLANQIEGGEPR